MRRSAGAMRGGHGFALVTVLMVSVVLLLIVLGAAISGSIDRSISGNQLRSNAAYYAADAGLADLRTAVYRKLVSAYQENPNGWCTTPLEDGIDFGSFTLSPDVPSPWIALGTSGSTYRFAYHLSDTELVLTSVGAVGTGRATVRMVASAAPPTTAWNNAIFAEGQSPDAQAINGNVSVYGSMHIVNGDLSIDDSAYSVSGTAGMYNGYFGSGDANTDLEGDAQLLQVVPTTSVDLCARLKVASGSVYLASQSSVVGASGHPIYSINLGLGNVYDGKYGTGNPKLITDWHGSGLVYLKYPTSSGINSGYGDYAEVPFPKLADDYPKDRGFLASRGTVDANGDEICAWLFGGADGSAWLPPAASGTSPVCGDADNYVQWVADGGSGYLRIAGTVNLGATDLLFQGADVAYAGEGALRVGTDGSRDHSITMDGSALRPYTRANFANPDSPTPDALALVTPGDISVSLHANDQVTAFLGYAGGTFTASGQATLVGSIVAGTFDLGNQVPRILYSPGVHDAAESLCLPGTLCAGSGNQGALSRISIQRVQLPADWPAPAN